MLTNNGQTRREPFAHAVRLLDYLRNKQSTQRLVDDHEERQRRIVVEPPVGEDSMSVCPRQEDAEKVEGDGGDCELEIAHGQSGGDQGGCF